MATACRCDICGMLHETYNTTRNLKKPNGIRMVNNLYNGKCHHSDVIELCPECMSSILEHIEFLKVKKVED